MEFKFTNKEEAFRQELQAWVRQDLGPNWQGIDHLAELEEEGFALTRQVVKRLAHKGWLTLEWPKQYGGQERSHMERLIYREEMAYHRVPGIDMGTGGISWVGPTLVLYGTEEQKREHLPPLARGEKFWCTLYSEPGSGSDLASLQTRAVADGDDYVIRGQKIWTTGGHRADWGWLAARTNPNAPKHKGMSLFLVDMKSPGITIRPIVNMANSHHFNEVFFDDVRIPKRNRVGEEDHGWYILAVALDFERSGVAYSASGRRNLEEMVEYAREVKKDGEPILKDPVVRNRLGELTAELEVARFLAYRVAWMQSRGKIANYEASMSKSFGTELTQRLYSFGMHLLGLHGQLAWGSKWVPLKARVIDGYLNAVSSTIAAGTTEVQRNIIATRGLGLPR